MKQIIVLIICSTVLFSALGQIKNYNGYKVFSITPSNSTHLKLIGELHNVPGLDIWSSARIIGIPTTIMVPPNLESQFKERLQANNLNYRIKINDLQRVFDLERRLQFLRRRKEPYGISFAKYNRFSEINDYLLNLTKKYPETASLINIGKTYEGRKLNVLKISTGGNGNKPAIFVDGGIHAREWIAPAQVLYIINQLLENQVETKDMIDQVDWYLLPVLNPDGYEYSHTNERLWRKTRSVNKDSSCRGADENRNFGFHWREVGASSSPCSDTYAGPKNFSEPEAQALSEFAMKIRDQVKLYLTFHSYGQYILYPWGYTSELPEDADELHELGVRVRAAFVKYPDYTIGSSTNVLYPAAGGSDDWFKGVAGVQLSYTIELPGGGSSGFDLPAKDILPVVTDTFRGVRVYADYVKDKFSVRL